MTMSGSASPSWNCIHRYTLALNMSRCHQSCLSQIFDVMGYDVPSPYNKINIHIGGVYGGKQDTLKRFAANAARLSPACRARLTVENDDTPNAFSLEDLLPMAHATGIPLVFDFHHFKFIDSAFRMLLTDSHIQHPQPRCLRRRACCTRCPRGRSGCGRSCTGARAKRGACPRRTLITSRGR